MYVRMLRNMAAIRRAACPGSELVTAARAAIFAALCGCFTHRYTRAAIRRLYRLTSPAWDVQPSYNLCPTDTVNVVTSIQDTRDFYEFTA
jgi:hypothetical protein